MPNNGNPNQLVYKLINKDGQFFKGNLVNYPYTWESKERAQSIADRINKDLYCVYQDWRVVAVSMREAS